MASSLGRLREVRMIQWALAYLAGACLGSRLLDALADPLSLPTGTQCAILDELGLPGPC